MTKKLTRNQIYNLFQALELCKAKPVPSWFRYAIAKNQAFLRPEIEATEAAFPVDSDEGYHAELKEAAECKDFDYQCDQIARVQKKWETANAKRADQVKAKGEHLKGEVDVRLWMTRLPDLPPIDGDVSESDCLREQAIVESLALVVDEGGSTDGK